MSILDIMANIFGDLSSVKVIKLYYGLFSKVMSLSFLNYSPELSNFTHESAHQQRRLHHLVIRYTHEYSLFWIF